MLHALAHGVLTSSLHAADNEIGYSSRLAELLCYMASRDAAAA